MNNKRRESLNYNIIFILLLLFLVSCLAIYSAQQTEQYHTNFLTRQIIWYVVGMGLIAAAMVPDEEQLNSITWYFYIFNILLLVFLIIAPTSIAPLKNNAKSWFVLPGVGSIQPSEFMKIALVLALSKVTQKHNDQFRIRSIKSDFRLFMKLGLTLLLPIILVMKQPDLGTTLVMVFLFVVMTFMSGITWKILVPIFGSIAALGVGLIYMVLYQAPLLEKYLPIQAYQFDRIYVWFDPESYASGPAYNYIQVLHAIGSGQLTGRDTSKTGLYVPEKHSDFIFSAIGESYGFVGTSIVLILFMVLIYLIIAVSVNTKDAFSTYICSGVVAVFLFHVLENIGMCIGLLPITGIPLPFISYGGSSLMSSMIMMGLVMNISFRSKSYMFEQQDLR